MGLFKKCCDGVCDLEIGDLPTVTITGMTGAGWEQVGACCYKQEFEPDVEPGWTTETSLDYFDCLLDTEQNGRVIGKAPYVRPFYTESAPPPDPMTEPEFCCFDYEQMGTYAYNYRFRDRRRMVIEYKFIGLTVYISQYEHTCLGTGLKWIVSIKHHFTHQEKLQRLLYEFESEEWVPSEPCYELGDLVWTGPSAGINYHIDYGSEDWVDFVATADTEVAVGPTTTYLLKHKVYDTLPASIVFGDSEEFTECPADCHELNAFGNDYCILIEVEDGTIQDPWLPQTCVAFSNGDLPASVNMQPVGCYENVAVMIYPDTPPPPPDDCLPVGIIVDIDVTCTPEYFNYEILPFGFIPAIKQTDACCEEITDPCDVVTTECTVGALLDVTYYSTAQTGHVTDRLFCIESTVTLTLS